MELSACGLETVHALTARGLTLSTAESCTGGQLAAAITSVPGSSAVYIGGIVAYADGVKQALLRVEPALLARQGAVSEECARAMALGCQHGFATDWALSTTGIAGPGGGTIDKPVGLVWFGWARAGGRVHTQCCSFSGDRAAVQRQSVEHSLRVLLELLTAHGG
jgi:nicotinamide-nucleotide amidase